MLNMHRNCFQSGLCPGPTAELMVVPRTLWLLGRGYPAPCRLWPLDVGAATRLHAMHPLSKNSGYATGLTNSVVPLIMICDLLGWCFC